MINFSPFFLALPLPSFADMVSDETSRELRIPSLFLLGKDGHIIYRTLSENNLKYALINIPVNMTWTI